MPIPIAIAAASRAKAVLQVASKARKTYKSMQQAKKGLDAAQNVTSSSSPQDPEEERKERNGPISNLINRANDFQRAQGARKKLDAFRGAGDAKKMLNAAMDPQSAIMNNIPGLGGKNGPLGKLPKELQKARRVIQLASKIPPPVWIGIGIALAILLIFFFIVTVIASISGGGGGNANGLGGGQPPIENPDGFSEVDGFKLFLSCTDEVATIDGIATCSVSYTYDATIATTPLENIVIHFELPTNTVFSSAFPSATTLDDKTYSWPLSIPGNQTTLQISFTSTQNDRFVDALAYISFVDGFSNNTLPTLDTCGGKYTLTNPIGNFGDPTCTYTNNQLYLNLRAQDPVNADLWYYKIVPCESSYIPVAYNPLAVDSAGAWGLFQMGRGLNGKYDHGDVAWEQQITNAIEYNKLLMSSAGIGPYWACAF